MAEPDASRIALRRLASAWCTLLAIRITSPWRDYRTLRANGAGRDLSPAPDALARHLAAHVRLAARGVPGARCLAQALALRSMLARRGYASALHVGVGRPRHDGTFSAHAWVTCGGVPVIGDDLDDFAAYTPMFELS